MLLSLTSQLIGNLPLLLLGVVLDAILHIVLQLAAFASGKLIELKLENLTTTLVDDVADDFNDAALLLWGEKADVLFENVLLVLAHGFVIDRLVHCLLDKVGHLILLSLSLLVVQVLLIGQ